MEPHEKMPEHNPELIKALEDIVANPKFDAEIRAEYEKLLRKPYFLRDQGVREHFSTYILPYNPKTKEVLIVFHKKARQWVAPGGHIDSNESLLQTINRESREELGVTKDAFSSLPEPIHLSILDLEKPRPTCSKHYDIWYLLETDGEYFDINMEEFDDAKWTSLSVAKQLMTDPSNLDVIKKLEERN